MVKVSIQKNPLLIIIRSVIEYYPYEVLGYSYGKIKNSNYIIENAQPAQATKKRTFTEIESTDRSEHALKLGTDSLDTLLGTYHSHTKYPTNNGFQLPSLSLSNQDLKDMIEYKEDISILLTINKTNRKWSLKKYHDEVYGTILFKNVNYLIHMKAYYLEGKRKRIVDLKIQKKVLEKLFE